MTPSIWARCASGNDHGGGSRFRRQAGDRSHCRDESGDHTPVSPRRARQFVRDLEEGTWAVWLYDLLKPHLTRVVVCGPRKNALLKAGNKNDQIDARKLSELLYIWPAGVCTPLSCGVACEDLGSRCTSSCGNLLLAVGHLGGIAPGSATGTLSGKPETSGHELTTTDSLDRPHPRRSVDRTDPDAQPLSYQAPAVGLLWLSTEDLHQRRISFRQWPAQTFQESRRPRAKPQPQS